MGTLRADRHVALAMRMIREEACGGLQISDLACRVPIARRLLGTSIQVGNRSHFEGRNVASAVRESYAVIVRDGDPS